MSGKMRVFAAGGCGCNIGKILIKQEMTNRELTGFAEIDVAFLDTSASNLKGMSAEKVHCLEGMDGSGKKREANVDKIALHIKSILQRFNPMDLNVVVSSGSGGSGSVFTPLIVQELLSENKPTVVILVGSTDSIIEHRNTTRTLLSLEAMSQRTQKPLPVIYLENNSDKDRDEVNASVVKLIGYLSILFSRQNDELDSADLVNFLYYDRVSNWPNRMVYLDIQTGNKPSPVKGELITFVSLSSKESEMVAELPSVPSARFTGYYDDAVNQIEVIKKEGMITYALYYGYLNKVMEGLDASLIERNREVNAAVILDTPDISGCHKSGIVL